MRIATFLKASALAVALAAGATSPVSAHGAISSEVISYDEYGQQVGHFITYCDGHQWVWGVSTTDSHLFVYECP